MYRFLLAGLYKNGRYFEDAFEEYKAALTVDPGPYQARINLGNIFFLTGQYGEAISNYRRALDVNPRSALAYYNMYLAQSQSFHLKEAEESLARARDIDAQGHRRTCWRAGGRDGEHAAVVDATVRPGLGLEGGARRRSGPARCQRRRRETEASSCCGTPLTVASLAALSRLALAACGRSSSGRERRHGAASAAGGPSVLPARPTATAHEYCSQCVHLFVLGDGLAPETKS